LKILVTGATGFVGSRVVPALLERGIEVIATCRSREKAEIFPWAGRVDWRQFNVFDLPANPFESLGGPDRMIHLAWSGLPNYKDNFHLDSNLPADKSFLQAMLDGGLRHLLVAGTCYEYGMQEGEMLEDALVSPDTPYGQAKNLLREYLEDATEKTNSVFQWARLFYMSGAGLPPHSLFAQLQKAIDDDDDEFDMSGGQQIRDFMMVEEVAKHLVSIIWQTEISGIVNVCSGRDATLQTLVEEYLSERGASIKLNLGVYSYPDWEPYRFWGNNRKLQKIIESA